MRHTQAQLLDSLFGTERGLSASSEVRAEINELITQLEAKNPNPSLQEVRLLRPCTTLRHPPHTTLPYITHMAAGCYAAYVYV